MIIILLCVLIFDIRKYYYTKYKIIDTYFPRKKIIFETDQTIELPNVNRENFIPKIIYRTHYSKESIKPYEKVLEHTKNILPNYETKIFYDKDCNEYIRKNFSSRIYKAFTSISNDYGPAKADFFRYLVIYKEGGIYLDIKSSPIKNIDHIINNLNGKMAISNWTKTYLKYLPFSISNLRYWAAFTQNPYGEYQNWYIISGKGNPLLGEIIKNMVTNIEIGNKNKELYSHGKISVLCLTGPLMMTKVIEKYKNKNDYKYFNPNLDNHLIYQYINHKSIEKNNHYTENKNKCVLV